MTTTSDQNAAAPPRFDGLRALFINATLKRSPELSHTDGLIERSSGIMREHGVQVDTLRAVDHDIATGVWPDMTEHGWATDEWPALYRRVLDAHILVLCGPIWLGDNSSVMKRVIERLYACSSLLNEDGQYAYYGRAGGCLITGNEDGVKHCAMNVLYSLQHLGYTIPPQADAGWIGEAGPGPSYLDPGSGGPENDFTNRNTTFMTFNLMHIAQMLRVAGGIPPTAINAPSGTPAAGRTSPTPTTDSQRRSRIARWLVAGEFRLLSHLCSRGSKVGELAQDTRTSLKTSWYLLGPAFVAAIAYVDPGNVAANVSSGAQFGYLLLWVIVAANVMAALVQYLSAKLGLVTGRSLPEAIGKRMGRPARLAYWAQAEIVAMATDVAEVIGGAIALRIMFNLPLPIGGIITGVVSLLLLTIQDRRGQRLFERVITALLLVIAIGFTASFFVVTPPPMRSSAVWHRAFREPRAFFWPRRSWGRPSCRTPSTCIQVSRATGTGIPIRALSGAGCCASPAGMSAWRC